MTLKKSSIVFLLVLFTLLVFIIGVRRGQQVEKTNKIINYLISIPPTATIQPTQLPLEFQAYEHKDCKIAFLYPSFLRKTSASSTSAKFEGNFQSLEFDCSKNSAARLLEVKNLATIEVKLKEKILKARVKPDERTEKDAGPTILFTTTQPRTNKVIFVEISKSIYTLFDKTLEFLP